ncbi:MAG TPA: hypothetical protein VG271_05020, partial [Beijerinckiaceae bacterium]|nr:hypothetical protein [Beijerinckiaceae bacterium]
QLFQLMYAREDYGRPFMTPPDVPADRVAALREAFLLTMKDPDFLDDAKKLNFDIDPVSWQELTELTTRLYSTPEPVLKRMQEIMTKMQMP